MSLYGIDDGKPSLLECLKFAAQVYNERNSPRKQVPMKNNLSASAPPLTIMKKLEQEDMNMSDMEDDDIEELDKLTKAAERAMDRGDLDKAERLVDKAMAKAKKLRNTIEDDWSEAATKPKMNGNGVSAADDGEDDGEDDGDDDYDEDDIPVKKAILYPHDQTVPTNHEMVRPVTIHRNQESHSTDIVPAVGQPVRHKFDALVEHVQDRDQCSRNAAQSQARVEYPDTFASYQRHLAGQKTSAQQIVRGQNFVGKSRPAATFEDLVHAEMCKGCTEEIAGQRVLQKYGSAVTRNSSTFQKSDQTALARLEKRAAEISYGTGCSMDVALRKARLERPYLIQAMNSA